jgi:DNA-binding NarL/FixJ family response regulator
MSAARRFSKAERKGCNRILIVDDHPMIRERLREIICVEHGLEVCGEAEDRHSALTAVKNLQPDLAIVDLTLKNSHGLDLIKDLQAFTPEVAILVVSMHDESLHAERVIKAGARGYITKQEATRCIVEAIHTILSGEIYLSDLAASRVARKLSRHHAAGPTRSIDKLTDREIQVFELIGQGLSTREIAAQLHVGIPTVDTYRGRIKDKLDLKDANELLQFAIRWNQLGTERRT